MAQQYSTPVGNTVARFGDFHDAAKGGNAVTLEVTLDVASDVVEGLAPRPPVDASGVWSDQYVRRAKNAELLVARWIWDTDAGQTSSRSGVIGSSISYQSNPAVITIVKGAMGDYAEEEGKVEAPSGKAYVGRLRSRR